VNFPNLEEKIISENEKKKNKFLWFLGIFLAIFQDF
jgi:hypothetical protein